jgi:hypothetical protein
MVMCQDCKYSKEIRFGKKDAQTGEIKDAKLLEGLVECKHPRSESVVNGKYKFPDYERECEDFEPKEHPDYI